ncbi:MAG: T9SS type A sorting domain-containing protein [Saprospiraceae bacterium]|nr:T9SS type A sorting domain-containing protein [Saprospiraceae bacterium]
MICTSLFMIVAYNLSFTQANSNGNALCSQILQYMQGLTSGCEILYSQDLGHVDNISNQYATYITGLENNTGVLLPMIGGDYGLGGYDMNAINTTLENHWNQKKLVTLSWHLPNPWTSGDSWDVTNQDKLADLLDNTKPVAATWRSQLDEIATVLQDLKNRGVVVLWRPLHEANGYWFWWGHPAASDASDAAAFKALWQDMFNYFSVTKGLDNLLWVYSAGEGQFHNPTDFCYPGGHVVDIVGLDLYHDDLSVVQPQDFQNLINLNKVLAVTEFGPDIPNDPADYDYTVVHNFIKNNYPEVAYLHAWHSWQHTPALYHHNSFVENVNANTILNDACHQQIDPAVFDLTTNAYEVGSDFVRIYPNPSPNQLKIEGLLGSADIRIFDALGQLVQNLNGMSTPITIDLSTYVSGPYFLSIINQNNQQVWTHTMIVN